MYLPSQKSCWNGSKRFLNSYIESLLVFDKIINLKSNSKRTQCFSKNCQSRWIQSIYNTGSNWPTHVKIYFYNKNIWSSKVRNEPWQVPIQCNGWQFSWLEFFVLAKCNSKWVNIIIAYSLIFVSYHILPNTGRPWYKKWDQSVIQWEGHKTNRFLFLQFQ